MDEFARGCVEMLAGLLPCRHRFVVSERLCGSTRRDISLVLRVTPERIRQIEQEAVRKIRKRICRGRMRWHPWSESRPRCVFCGDEASRCISGRGAFWLCCAECHAEKTGKTADER